MAIRIPTEHCPITRTHGEHTVTVIGGPLSGARVDCPGEDESR